MILNIETSTNACSISIQKEDQLLGVFNFYLARSHSSLLPVAIDQLLDQTGITKKELKAVGISEGPGSYTGLRIGSSTAKAIAFGLSIPLISVNALDTMIYQLPQELVTNGDILAPMIDARRMEVYTKWTDYRLQTIREVQPMILHEDVFAELQENRWILFGNGAKKAFDFIQTDNKVLIENIHPGVNGMVSLVYNKYKKGIFEDVAYFEPLYLKEFKTKKSKDLLRP